MEKIMWKITSYDTDGSNPNKNRAIYCVKAGPGFGSGTQMGSGEIIKRNYTVSYNLKDNNFGLYLYFAVSTSSISSVIIDDCNNGI